MPDEIDQTAEISDRILELTRASIASRGRELNPSGFCHFCSEPLGEHDPKLGPARDERGAVIDARLFCDEYCSSDWERRRKSQSMR